MRRDRKIEKLTLTFAERFRRTEVKDVAGLEDNVLWTDFETFVLIFPDDYGKILEELR